MPSGKSGREIAPAVMDGNPAIGNVPSRADRCALNSDITPSAVFSILSASLTKDQDVGR